MRRYGFLIVAGATLMLTAGLLASSSPVVAQVPTEIRIGGTIAQTGPFSSEVGKFCHLMQTWVDMVNEAGGISMKEYNKKLPLKLFCYDDKSDRQTSVNFYERLATVDKVHLFIGPYSSPISVGASTVAEKYKIPMVLVEANADVIFARNFKYIVGVIDTGTIWSDHLFDMWKASGKAKTIAFIVQDHLHATDVAKGAREAAKRAGIREVFHQVTPIKTEDFTPQITEMKRHNPDIVYVSSFPAYAVTFVKQAVEQGLKPRAVHVIHHAGGFEDAVGKLAQSVTGEDYWVPGLKFGNVKRFQDLERRSGVKVVEYQWTPIRYYAFDTIEAGLQKAGTLDQEKLLAAIKGLEIETLCGRLKFKPNGQGTCNTYPTQWQGDKRVIVWPKEVATGTYVYPMP